jgi:glutamate synthase (NADPH/NADH) small chain
MQLSQPDSSGRRSPVDTGQTIALDVDMVIKATGQMPFSSLVQATGLGHTNGKINSNPEGATGIGGVFAGGDCVNGGKEVVDAVQAGKESAAAIIHYLKM